MFWALDAYYLSRERLFRALYDQVRERDEGDIDFSMNVREFSRGRRFGDWFRGIFSKTQWPFYLMLTGLTAMASALAARLGGGP